DGARQLVVKVAQDDHRPVREGRVDVQFEKVGCFFPLLPRRFVTAAFHMKGDENGREGGVRKGHVSFHLKGTSSRESGGERIQDIGYTTDVDYVRLVDEPDVQI